MIEKCEDSFYGCPLSLFCGVAFIKLMCPGIIGSAQLLHAEEMWGGDYAHVQYLSKKSCGQKIICYNKRIFILKEVPVMYEYSGNRFEAIYRQGAMQTYKVIVDKATGVNYLQITSGYAGGLTPLLDSEGKPIITTLY